MATPAVRLHGPFPRPRGSARAWWRLARRSAALVPQYGGRVAPPPAEPAKQVAYGFAQPLLGLRILLSDTGLLMEAATPAAVLAAVCAVVASLGTHEPGRLAWFRTFYKTFAYLAPLPSLIFANHYARLAAVVRWRLGFGACGPRELPLPMLAGRMLRQAILVAVGVVPFLLVPALLPGIGHALTTLIVALWGMQWIVADALDDARVLLPGETLRQSIEDDHAAMPPWFVRAMLATADRLGRAGRPLRWFARVCDKLALDSRGELALMERHRALSIGFALSTAALLALPGLNLLFRPIILVAASHLLGYLEQTEPRHALHG